MVWVEGSGSQGLVGFGCAGGFGDMGVGGIPSTFDHQNDFCRLPMISI